MILHFPLGAAPRQLRPNFHGRHRMIIRCLSACARGLGPRPPTSERISLKVSLSLSLSLSLSVPLSPFLILALCVLMCEGSRVRMSCSVALHVLTMPRRAAPHLRKRSTAGPGRHPQRHASAARSYKHTYIPTYIYIYIYIYAHAYTHTYTHTMPHDAASAGKGPASRPAPGHR